MTDATTEKPRKYSNVAAISHELRAPLHAISGLAELLLKSDLDPADRNVAASIHRESQALESIVSDLLELERADAGELQIVRQSFAPRLLIGEVVSAYATNATDKGLQLTAAIDDELPLAVIGDRHRIRQILINLVSNAIKYTSTGGVTIGVGIINASTTRLRIAVADTGPGVPDDALPLLFEPFKQSRPGDRVAGTGLGLPLTKRLISLLDGTCVLDTSPDGSTFTIEIPVTPARGEQAVDAPAENPASGRVLVVDDTEVNRMLADAQLQRLGYEAACAVDGAEALKRLDVESFDAVLLDWHMPGMDGLEVTARIRTREATTGERLPIILTTASVTDADREKCLAHDVSEFLPKPVSLGALGECLGRWIDPGAAVGASHADAGLIQEPHNALVDPAAIDVLIEDLGSVEVVAGVIDTYLSDTPERLGRLQPGADPLECRREVHTLKTTAALLGAGPLAQRCSELEQQWSDSRPPTESEVESLKLLAAETVEALSERRNQLIQQTSSEAP